MGDEQAQSYRELREQADQTGSMRDRARLIEFSPAEHPVALQLGGSDAGKLAEASRTLDLSLPLASVLARICPAPCEKACRRSFADAPVSIRLLMRRVVEAGAALGHGSNDERAATSRDRKGADIPGIDVGVSAPLRSRLVALQSTIKN